MHYPESVRENQTHKLLWNFAKRLDLVIINKKRELAELWTLLSRFTRVKLKETEKKDKYLDIARELKKTVEHESDSDPNCNWCSLYSHQRTGTRTGGYGNKKTSGDHLNYSIIEIDQNTEKSPGDLRRLAVTYNPARKHRLTLVWKTRKEIK